MISLKRLLEKKQRERQIMKERDSILKRLRNMKAEAKRIRALPRDEVDALIAETVGLTQIGCEWGVDDADGNFKLL